MIVCITGCDFHPATYNKNFFTITVLLLTCCINAVGQQDCGGKANQDKLILSYIQDSILYAVEEDIQEAEPDNEQTESLYNSMLEETDVDLRNAKLIALAGCIASENIYDYKERILDEMEQSMEAGVYSPLLFTLWRAYRFVYNEMYACASTYCYSPNIRYNYYRRLVAHTILKYVEAHPDDTTARFLFQRLSAHLNIMRNGPYPYGNQAALERMYVFWQGEIW